MKKLLGGAAAFAILANSRPPAPARGSMRAAGRAGRASAGWCLGANLESSPRGAHAAQPPDFVMIALGGAVDGRQALAAARRMLGSACR